MLREMFSPIGAPSEEDKEIDWLGDLKFFIDNDERLLSQYLFPAVKKHSGYQGHPEAYKFYMKPVERCLEAYCDKYSVEDAQEKFPKENLIELAKKICSEQERHMQKGDYDNR